MYVLYFPFLTVLSSEYIPVQNAQACHIHNIRRYSPVCPSVCYLPVCLSVHDCHYYAQYSHLPLYALFPDYPLSFGAFRVLSVFVLTPQVTFLIHFRVRGVEYWL